MTSLTGLRTLLNTVEGKNVAASNVYEKPFVIYYYYLFKLISLRK